MIVYACADLMFASKVSATCEAESVVSRPARSASMLQARLDRVDDGKAHDAVSAVFIELTRDDALDLIRQANQHPETPTIVAFGPHVDTGRLDAAKGAGADQVLTRGAFAQRLPELIHHLAKP